MEVSLYMIVYRFTWLQSTDKIVNGELSNFLVRDSLFDFFIHIWELFVLILNLVLDYKNEIFVI